MNIRCIKCKGRDPSICGRTFCPIVAKISAQKKVNIEAKEEYFGESPNVFVGRFGYPDVNVGVLSTEHYEEHDNPLLWSKENYDIAKIINLRSSLINSNFKAQITGFKERYLAMSQEIGMAKNPVDVEIGLSKKPSFSLSFGQDTMPHGPSVKLKKARITENPKIPKKVDKVVSDIDLKATKALSYLYKHEVDEHYLTRLLSIGTLGVKKQRKLVPTRWSITAVDDTLAKEMIKQVKDYQVTDYTAFFGGHLGNYYVALFFPEVWSYELFETYAGKSTWHDSEGITTTTDYEGYNGRKDYASNTVGGYYAARLPVLEHLKKIKRQASVLLLRFITGEYYAPLGVWVVREAVRKTLASKPLNFGSKELMLNYTKVIVKKKFGINADLLLNKSILLNTIKTQKKLNEF
ncbi:MAG: Nre family DNA repair protein [Nanoarchaeota archaeon]|nr:Nre family DNA repair protein [Nanoarchaeota archaeon]MBU1322379.1 Nre family DNA repair protein [Nanoarchaeota archaeon]MBU1598406.1 Nre family DNA repair protein [Nanoarchaeota archaeon]MBU2440783.1 Nre family DNA repair protein [Nanoarchaeota archaeon]